jgi:predicted O-methyltransferase YrrM
MNHDKLYIAATKANEVVCFNRAWERIAAWTLPGEQDSAHLNSLAVYKDRLVASIFGRFTKHEEYKLGTSGLGEIIDIKTGETLINGLSQPHSLTVHNNLLYFCNSQEKKFCIYNGDQILGTVMLPGYCRGVAVGHNHIYVGISLSRNISSSEHEVSTGMIAVIDRTSLQCIGLTPIPFSEIYDIKIVSRFEGLLSVFVANSQKDEKLHSNLPGKKQNGTKGKQNYIYPYWLSDEALTLGGVEFFLTTDIKALHESHSTRDRFLLGKHRVMVEDLLVLREQEDIKRIVDIGIFKGGSVALYALLFSPEKMVGIEYAASPEKSLEKFIEQRSLQNQVRTYYGTNQADTARLRKIVESEFGDEPLDLIVDDASHLYNETRASFEALFPLLRPGGIYIIEDWGWAHWQGDLWQKSKIFAAQMPSLTNLLVEISMLCASRPDLVANVQIEASVIKIRRGCAILPGNRFKLKDECLNRGKPFVPIF